MAYYDKTVLLQPIFSDLTTIFAVISIKGYDNRLLKSFAFNRNTRRLRVSLSNVFNYQNVVIRYFSIHISVL